MLRAVRLAVCFFALTSVSVLAQTELNAGSLGAQAVHALMPHLVVIAKNPVPKTGQQLPTNGHWSMSGRPPAQCANVQAVSGPCIQLIYSVPDADVSCKWVVLLNGDATDVTFLDENDDAARYFMPKLSPMAVKALVVRSSLPTYPPIAQAAHVQGSVKVPVLVRSDGNFSAVNPSGPPMLIQAAISAMSDWRFKPLQIAGRPTAFETEITFQFKSSGFSYGGTVDSTP